MATRKKTKPDPARDAMMLVEFARVGRPAVVAKKYGVHHSYVQRLWDALSDDEREMYRCQANNVVDFATERLVQEQSDAIHTINERLLTLTMRSLDEYEERISDKLLSKEIVTSYRLWQRLWLSSKHQRKSRQKMRMRNRSASAKCLIFWISRYKTIYLINQ